MKNKDIPWSLSIRVTPDGPVNQLDKKLSSGKMLLVTLRGSTKPTLQGLLFSLPLLFPENISSSSGHHPLGAPVVSMA